MRFLEKSTSLWKQSLVSLTFSTTHEFGVLRFKLKPKQNYETAFKNQLNTILFDTIWYT